MALPHLTRRLIETKHAPADLPERVIQFGDGVFLRGFVDWMIHEMNSRGVFNGRVVVVSPRGRGPIDQLNVQDGLFTLLLRGVENGRMIDQRQVIESISRGINPYRDYEEFLRCAQNPDLRVIVSN